MKDFLSTERKPTEEMTQEELATEVEGFRAMVSMMPQEVIEWMIRLGEPFRIITRKYEPKTGVLVNVRFEATEYVIQVMEPSFDSVRGVRLIEEKLITLGNDATLYYEDVLQGQDYEEWIDEQNLAKQSLEGM